MQDYNPPTRTPRLGAPPEVSLAAYSHAEIRQFLPTYLVERMDVYQQDLHSFRATLI